MRVSGVATPHARWRFAVCLRRFDVSPRSRERALGKRRRCCEGSLVFVYGRVVWVAD